MPWDWSARYEDGQIWRQEPGQSWEDRWAGCNVWTLSWRWPVDSKSFKVRSAVEKSRGQETTQSVRKLWLNTSKPLWKSIRRFIKKLKLEFPFDLVIPFQISCKRINNRVLQWFTHAYVYTGEILEAALKSISGWTDKRKLWYLHKIEYHSVMKMINLIHFRKRVYFVTTMLHEIKGYLLKWCLLYEKSKIYTKSKIKYA